MKKTLVTGADGFIGSHLTEKLLADGHEVRAFVLYNSFNSWGWLDSLPKAVLKEIDVFAGDVRDPDALKEAMKGVGQVFHLAALISIAYSYRVPGSYVETNVKGTLNVLQAAREASLDRILITSTSEVYGSAQYVPMDEKHPLQARSPYSASKIGADRLAESFYRSFDLPVTIVRPFNTYGPRQSARAVIPTIISQLLKGEKTIRLGNLTPTRDFSFVLDICQGFLDIFRSGKAVGEEINIGSGMEISIAGLAQMLIELINPEAVIERERKRLRPEKSEVERLLACTKKIRRIGWSPQYTLEQGLKLTLDWIRDSQDRFKTDIYNV